MRTISYAKTKLILFGEHAAVYGHPAVGLPLPWRIGVSLTPSEVMKWNVDGLEEKHREKLDRLLLHLPTVFPELSKIAPRAISLFSDAPIGVGLGSSSALCTALTRAIFTLYEEEGLDPLAENDPALSVWASAHRLEKIFHKTPSGIDTGISTYETLSAFAGRDGDLPRCTALKTAPFWLVMGALPRSSDTATLVSGLRQLMQADHSARTTIDELGTIAATAITAFSRGKDLSVRAIGTLATEAHRKLQQIGLSTPLLDEMLTAGTLHGALGGKLSGAGGGGAYFLVANGELHATELAKALCDYSKEKSIHHILLPTAIACAS